MGVSASVSDEPGNSFNADEHQEVITSLGKALQWCDENGWPSVAIDISSALEKLQLKTRRS